MKRVGLFIGIDRYSNGISPLKCAVNDAGRVKELFAADGFEITSLFNEAADRNSIVNELKKLKKYSWEKDDIFVFYFSGHGCEKDDNHYLFSASADFEFLNYNEGLFPLKMLKEATDVPGLKRLFILDCCRSEIVADGRGTGNFDNARDIALGKLADADPDVPEIIPPVILTSCSSGQRSFENEELQQGYFTNVLLDTIKDDTVNSFEKFKWILFRNTEELARQHGVRQVPCFRGNPLLSIPLFEAWNQCHPVFADFTQKETDNYYRLQIDIENKFRDFFDVCKNYPSDVCSKFDALRKRYLELNQSAVNHELLTELENLCEEVRNISAVAARCEQIREYISSTAQMETLLTRYDIKIDTELQKLRDIAFRAFENSDYNNAFVNFSRYETELRKFLDQQKVYIMEQEEFENAEKMGMVFSSDGKTLLECTNRYLDKCSIPYGVCVIGQGAFRKCICLDKVNIPSTVSEIKSDAFWNCNHLTQINIPASVVCIGERAFAGTKIENIRIPESVCEIGKEAFASCILLRSVKIPCRFRSRARQIGLPYGLHRLLKVNIVWGSRENFILKLKRYINGKIRIIYRGR